MTAVLWKGRIHLSTRGKGIFRSRLFNLVRQALNWRTWQGSGQSGNAHAITSNWGISQEKCSLASSQDENQKANHLKGVCGHDWSSCTLLEKPACLITSLKCLYINTCSKGNKQEKLEICVWLQGHDLTAITETLWDSSHDCNAAVDGYVLFSEDRPAIQGGRVAVYVRATGIYGPWRTSRELMGKNYGKH